MPSSTAEEGNEDTRFGFSIETRTESAWESQNMVQKVIKYGNSMAVILPKESADSAGIEIGSLVTTFVEGGRVIIQPVDVVPRLSPENQEFVDRLYEKRRKVFEALAE